MTLLDDGTHRSAASGLDGAERAALERGTAQMIEWLSLSEISPDGTPRLSSRVHAKDVGWTDSSWVSCLAEVEEWLGLDDELPFHSRDLLSRVIAKALGFSTTAEAYTGAATALVLSDTALERLQTLLNEALQEYHRSQEAQVLRDHDAEGLLVASSNEEDDEVEVDQSSDPIAARAAVWNINEFSSRALRGKLNLSPSYQRGDVWPIADAQLLIESILRGIPLPSVIVMKPHDDRSPYEVVDGKQRLTAILRFIGAHPEAVRTVKEVGETNRIDLLSPFQLDYPRFRTLWKSVTGQALTAAVEKELYFPFRLGGALRGALEPFRGKYYSQIRTEIVEVAEERIEVSDLFERVTEYKIPVIEYLKASHTQIHEVFNLYNKQGKHLNAEEIRNALFHDLDLMRGILVGSGDNNDLETVAPFLATRWASVRPMAAALTSLGFGTVRYRRSKVLSWVAALLAHDSRDAVGKARRLSTAAQINSFLRRVQDDQSDSLREQSTLVDLFTLLARAIVLVEQMPDSWSAAFKGGGKDAQWQELPLVGTLVGIAAAAAVLDDEVGPRLRAARGELTQATSSESSWARLEKAQTTTQWSYIATVALGTIRALGVDPHEASLAIRRRVGQSGLQALLDVEARSR